jgi:hypothetical protein
LYHAVGKGSRNLHEKGNIAYEVQGEIHCVPIDKIINGNTALKLKLHRLILFGQNNADFVFYRLSYLFDREGPG